MHKTSEILCYLFNYSFNVERSTAHALNAVRTSLINATDLTLLPFKIVGKSEMKGAKRPFDIRFRDTHKKQFFQFLHHFCFS